VQTTLSSSEEKYNIHFDGLQEAHRHFFKKFLMFAGEEVPAYKGFSASTEHLSPTRLSTLLQSSF
jgi:hypothetical protein